VMLELPVLQGSSSRHGRSLLRQLLLRLARQHKQQQLLLLQMRHGLLQRLPFLTAAVPSTRIDLLTSVLADPAGHHAADKNYNDDDLDLSFDNKENIDPGPCFPHVAGPQPPGGAGAAVAAGYHQGSSQLHADQPAHARRPWEHLHMHMDQQDSSPGPSPQCPTALPLRVSPHDEEDKFERGKPSKHAVQAAQQQQASQAMQQWQQQQQ